MPPGFFAGNMSYLATIPSCVFYVRATGLNGGTIFRDWSNRHQTISSVGSPVNSSTSQKYPPCSIALNGSQYLSVPDSDLVELTSGYVISILANITQLVYEYTAYRSALVEKYYNSDEYGLQVRGSSVSSVTSVTWGNGDTDIIEGTSNLPSLGAWHRYTVSKPNDSSTVTLYVDGNVSGIGTAASAPTQNSSPLLIGKMNVQGLGLTWGLDGYVDEAAMWNGAYGALPDPTKITTLTRRMIVG
jgi:hypothetical protein